MLGGLLSAQQVLVNRPYLPIVLLRGMSHVSQWSKAGWLRNVHAEQFQFSPSSGSGSGSGSGWAKGATTPAGGSPPARGFEGIGGVGRGGGP